ncbi:hypothetical protein, conserved [Plasmodium gonderi]|uniref:Calponin-homology (CH) domain-containing protein n=1 Tax=Plasmodium gonderi TaxID=77519 RepID=A0A1Y1J8Z6_PLAGO|nr:hypothetical protein, conserved [Plasmodium gonderi]GAW78979.1 hypothetical protein, conserved [Plasmodium gonderi]
MKPMKYEHKGSIYNEITKQTSYAQNKDMLSKTKWLGIFSISVIIDWLNSLLLSKKILNEKNIYEELKNGFLILKLIQLYNPQMKIHGIFPKATEKKCSIQNLEKALSIVYGNNPYYYSMVSSLDIYEKKKNKIHILLIQLFNKFEFQILKKISIPLLNWYNLTLQKFQLQLHNETLSNPFNVPPKKLLINCSISDGCHGTNHYNTDVFFEENNSHVLKKYKIGNTRWKAHVLKNFATYVLFKDKEERERKECTTTTIATTTPHIVEDFSDCVKMFLIFYRYGYITQEQLMHVDKVDIRNKYFFLQNLLTKLNIPVILKNQYLNNPCEVAILLQLKFIQFFIRNNDYERAIDLSGTYFIPDLLRQNVQKTQKKKKKKKELNCTQNSFPINSSNDGYYSSVNPISENLKKYEETELNQCNDICTYSSFAAFDKQKQAYTQLHTKIAISGLNNEIKTSPNDFLTCAEEKKKKKILNKKQFSEDTKENIIPMCKGLEMDIFRRTPTWVIRKMFYQHDEELAHDDVYIQTRSREEK